MLALNGLPQFYHPSSAASASARVTDDRFFISIEAARSAVRRGEETERFLGTLGAVGVERLAEPGAEGSA